MVVFIEKMPGKLKIGNKQAVSYRKRLLVYSGD